MAINTVGLAVGIAACLLVFLLIQYETGFDNFHKNKERIYRVVAANKTPEGMSYSQGSALPVAEALRADYPQLEQVARIYARNDQQITIINDKAHTPQKKFKEQVFYAEPEFFSIFNFPFLAGDPKTALAEINTVVLTRQIAEKYFGNWHTAIGNLIKYNDNIFKVTGILQNTPVNTDFPLQVVFSFKSSVQEDISKDWIAQDGSLNTFVVLPENMPAEQLESDLKALVKKYTPAEYANQGYILQPLHNIHYERAFGTFSGKTFSKELITALSLISLFLLIIACINFINLATAQAVNRSKEVGIRKVLGSSKMQLIIQFLSETFLITLASVIIAVGVAFIALPLLNHLLQTSVKIQFGYSLMVFLCSLIMGVTLLSGFYPAIVLSGFNPIAVLKNKFTGKTAGGFSMRKALVVFQFAIAQILIIGTLVVVHQMNFFQNADVGFDKEAIITVPTANDTARSKLDALKMQLQQQTGIKDLSLSGFSPMDQAGWDDDFIFDNAAKKAGFKADLKWADANYFTTYNIAFIAGRPYNPADTVNGFVVNEMMAKKLGFTNPEGIIGKKISFWDGKINAPVVGVVKDFNGYSLKEEMKPIVLSSNSMFFRLFNIKIQPQQMKQTLAAIERLWNKTYPDFIYEYQFLDEKIAGFYRQEHQLSQLFKIFAGIAIFISCLGLYGFVSFMAVQRTKEVGIRKVLGASAGSILYLFSKEFTLLIGIAFLIASPIAYYLMHRWLQNFAYRVHLGMGLFLLTILIAEVIAWLTVGYQAIKASVANPVKSLRME
ncbi:ABC transporter permease [Niabella ginsenosidivorans]|nr:ABC transporter permease [Niabella ginsenosidivorans]